MRLRLAFLLYDIVDNINPILPGHHRMRPYRIRPRLDFQPHSLTQQIPQVLVVDLRVGKN